MRALARISHQLFAIGLESAEQHRTGLTSKPWSGKSGCEYLRLLSVAFAASLPIENKTLGNESWRTSPCEYPSFTKAPNLGIQPRTGSCWSRLQILAHNAA